MKQICFFVLIACFASLGVQAQQADTTLGEIRGRVIDSKTKKPLDFVSIRIELNGIVKVLVLTDDEGYYVVKDLAPGEYTLKASYIGYRNVIVQELKIIDKPIVCNVMMEGGEDIIRCPVIRRTTPFFDPEGKSGKTYRSKEIQRLPYR